MSSTQYARIARSFVEEIFNAQNTEAAKNFVTPDIVYHGMGEEISGIEEFKKWVSKDLSAFPDMKSQYWMILVIKTRLHLNGP